MSDNIYENLTPDQGRALRRVLQLILYVGGGAVVLHLFGAREIAKLIFEADGAFLLVVGVIVLAAGINNKIRGSAEKPVDGGQVNPK